MARTAWSAWDGVEVVEPDRFLRGVVLVTVPHMDDEALACCGTIAGLSDTRQVHLVYATDGTQAPEPVLPWIDAVSPDLGAIRRAESIAAMTLLGVPRDNLHFLDLPERRLERHRDALATAIGGLMDRLKPDHVLTPFRYDRHRDHLALNRVVTAASRRRDVPLTEYFVYHHWRLLPRGDVRRYIHPGELVQVDIRPVAHRKRAALDCFKSQTTRFYPWQSRPNLTPALLDQVSREPELFLRYNAARPGPRVFDGPTAWIRVAHRMESPLKRQKDRCVAVWQRLRTAGRAG
jgi:LmbE family N-acetylglucosaminyl deacetylase